MGTEDVAIRSVEDWRAEFDRINAALDRAIAIAQKMDTDFGFQYDAGRYDALRDARRLVNGGDL